MAAVSLEAPGKDIMESMDLAQIPEKLRCTNCHNLNLTPYKTSCCDVYICESCFNDHRNSSCPKCEHKPFTEEICKPNKAMGKTVKTWLKSQEKAKTDAQEKADVRQEPAVQTNTEESTLNGEPEANVPVTAEAAPEISPPQADVVDSEENPANDVQPSIEEPDTEVVDNDDDIEFQVELEEDEQRLPTQRLRSTDNTPQPHSAKSFENHTQSYEISHNNNSFDGTNNADYSNNMGSFGSSMDPAQMLQMMQANMQAGGLPFNPMMAMTMMNMNQMSGMLGGFGGANGGMNMNGLNGMNMGMNFDPSQGMYAWNGSNNNMWQNNSANAFPNGMGNNYGSNYGSNMEPNGNFQQNYPSGDFQNGYYNRGSGRGRGRGRGGFGRNRGSFNQYSQYQQQQGYQNGLGPRHLDNRTSHVQMAHNDHTAQHTDQGPKHNHDVVEDNHEDDDFAPGGQEEVIEALGEEYHQPSVVKETAEPDTADTADTADIDTSQAPESAQRDDALEAEKVTETNSKEDADATGTETPKPIMVVPSTMPIPEAYNEDLQTTMAPPSAPTGPSAQYADFGFRSRGHGRFSSRGRGSMSMSNGHVVAPVKPFSPAPQPEAPKGAGVVGAPTGPRAMREPPAPARPVSQSATTGFQIMGRASKAASTRSESRDVDRARSRSPDRDSRDLSRRISRQETSGTSRYEVDERPDHEYRDRTQEKRSKRSSKRDDYDERDDQESYAHSESGDHKLSSRRSRGDKDKSSKHSSRSKRRHEEAFNGDHEMDDYDDSARSSRDAYGDSRSKHRSSKSAKYDDREADRERDRDRDRGKTRDKERGDKDREREDRHREKGRESRKRSRNDRHREDNPDHKDTDDYDYEQHQETGAAEEDDTRHRRHKKRSRRDTSEHNDTHTHVNGRHGSGANNQSAPSTSASKPTEEKDIHLTEREQYAKERMLKEQQRRAKQATGPGTGSASGSAAPASLSRRISHKYEDDLERHLVEGERQRHGHGRNWR